MGAKPSIHECIAGHRDLRALCASLKIGGLEQVLHQPGPFTVFAPTDRAFHDLPVALVDLLLAGPERLEKVISFHILPERFSLEMLKTCVPDQKILGKKFTLFRRHLRVNGARIIGADVECQNGVIHLIDAVLFPEKERYEKLVRQAAFQRTRLLARSPSG